MSHFSNSRRVVPSSDATRSADTPRETSFIHRKMKMNLAMAAGRTSAQIVQKGSRLLQGRLLYRIVHSRSGFSSSQRPTTILPISTHLNTTLKDQRAYYSSGGDAPVPYDRQQPKTANRIANTTNTTTTLEVERKFAPTTESMQLLSNNTGPTPFKSLIPKGTVVFEDIYYDTPTQDLENAGVWLRRRDSVWEAKVRIGGNYTNSAFKEMTRVDEISALLDTLVPGASLPTTNDDSTPQAGGGGSILQAAARFISYRDKFLVDERFTVILDKTDFGHVVGEVELEKEVVILTRGSEGDGDAKENLLEGGARVSEVIAEMDTEIDGFMTRYVWAFPPGKPVGKLSAYFALKK